MYLRVFRGLSVPYRRFVKDFLTLERPLNNLLRKAVEFSWDKEYEDAFQHPHTVLCSPRVLALPNLPVDGEFILHTDASECTNGDSVVRYGCWRSRARVRTRRQKAIQTEEKLLHHHMWNVGFSDLYEEVSALSDRPSIPCSHRPCVLHIVTELQKSIVCATALATSRVPLNFWAPWS